MNNGDPPLGWVDRVVVPILGFVAASVLFALMILTCADVIGRYFLSRPIFGAFEITETLLAVLIFAGLPLVTLRNEHVTVDVFDPIAPDWVLHFQHVIACTLGFVSTAYLAYRLWLRAIVMDLGGETTGQIKYKLSYLAYSMSILMALTAVALLVLMFRKQQRSIPGEGPGA
jgi:TRAP-type transport system small permease protein